MKVRTCLVAAALILSTGLALAAPQDEAQQRADRRHGAATMINKGHFAAESPPQGGPAGGMHGDSKPVMNSNSKTGVYGGHKPEMNGDSNSGMNDNRKPGMYGGRNPGPQNGPGLGNDPNDKHKRPCVGARCGLDRPPPCVGEDCNPRRPPPCVGERCNPRRPPPCVGWDCNPRRPPPCMGAHCGPGYPPPIVHHPRPPGIVLIPRPHRPEGWYAPRMRAFRFCQTPRGAMMTLQSKVLFDTDKSDLRPAAIDTLEPLAAWLADHPGVEVAIDGHTDSRASDEYNQGLSERRAESVYQALVGMGATDVQFTVTGYGESRPVATNATASGMQLNRRVEVTLLDQTAETIGGSWGPCP